MPRKKNRSRVCTNKYVGELIESLMKNGIFTWLESASHKMLINCKGTKGNFIKRSLADTTLIKQSQGTSLIPGQIEIICHLTGINKRNTAPLLGYFC